MITVKKALACQAFDVFIDGGKYGRYPTRYEAMAEANRLAGILGDKVEAVPTKAKPASQWPLKAKNSKVGVMKWGYAI